MLLASALVLGLWLWFDRPRATDEERKTRGSSAFVTWNVEDLERITIVHDVETLVLQREHPGDRTAAAGLDDHWRMVAPRQERADSVAVRRLVSVLGNARFERKAAEGAALGFDAPRAKGMLRMGKLEVSFALGGASPTPEGSSYFRVTGESALVVSKEFTEALLASSDVYRDRAVVPYLATELHRLEARTPNDGFTLERLDERGFRVLETGVLASRIAIERVWAALAEMRAEAFPKDADVDALTAHPAVTLRLTPTDGAKSVAELVIGSTCPGHPADVIVLRKAPTRVAVCAPKDIVDAFVVDAAHMTETLVFGLRMDEIEEVRFASMGAQGALELARKGSGFHQRSPLDRDVLPKEAEAATELLSRITASAASSVARGGGAFSSIARTTLRSGEHEESVDIGTLRPDGGATLRRVMDDARLEVDASVVRRLLARETSLRARDALEGESRRVTGVLLRCGVEQELRESGEGLRLVSPRGFETDGAIVQLVDGIVRGHVDAWVADADDGHFGFTPDGCRVTLDVEEGASLATLWFGNEGEGGVYARVDSRTGVMVVPRALRELAGRIFVSRAALQSDAERVERVRVTAGGNVLLGGDPGALADAVASLTATSVLSLTTLTSPPDLLIDVTVREGGPPKRISCRAFSASERHCSAAGIRATFAVAESRLAPFLTSSAHSDDAGSSVSLSPNK